MAEENITLTETNKIEPQSAGTQQTQEVKAPEEKVVPKKLFDEKVSEMTKKCKALEAQLKEKMTDEEKKAAESSEKDAEFQALKSKFAALKTETELTAAGVKPEISKSLSAAIVSADVSAIVEAVKSAISDVEKDTTAKVKRELLENGSPKVPVTGGSKEKPDPNIAIVKSAINSNAPITPKEKSKWYN